MENQFYDENAFYVKQQRWGTWDSYDKEGKCIITSLTEENCIRTTRWYLKQKFEKIVDENAKVYNGSVDYKL